MESRRDRPGSRAVPDDSKARWPPMRIAQWVTIAILVVVSEAVSWAGHAAVSYGVDGVALLALLGFRQLRQSPARTR